MTPGSWLLPLAALLFAPLIPGIINRVKAFFAGRKGVPILQFYYDLAKLLHKGTVYSTSTTWVTRLAPAVVLGSVMLPVFLIPWGALRATASFPGDWIVLVYLLGLARFATVAAALDAGSSFEGMGASREVMLGVLVEPGIMLGMLVLAVHSGKMGFSEMFATIDPSAGMFGFAPLLLVAFSWCVALLTENSRIPVDDPNTHLELTMVHEVMILDSSGPDFGFMLYASSIKLWIFSALVANLLLLPRHLVSGWMQAPLFLLILGGIAVAIGIVESVMARLRFQRIPKLLIGSGALGAVALIVMLLGQLV